LEEYIEHVQPLANLTLDLHFQLAKCLDKFTIENSLSKSEKKKVKEAILLVFDELFSLEDATKEQVDLYDKWNDQKYVDEVNESLEEMKLEFKQQIEDFLGEKMKMEDLQGDSVEDFTAKFADRIKAKVQEKKEFEEKFHAKRRKTKREIEQERKQALIDEMKNKNIRSIYISLAKLLHPDTETDKEVKMEKEVIMKKVTEAYTKNDLVTLLQIEIEWVHKNNNYLHSLKDDVLELYCEILKQQIAELEQTKFQIKDNPRYDSIFESNLFGFKSPNPINIKSKILEYNNVNKNILMLTNNVLFLTFKRSNLQATLQLIKKYYHYEEDLSWNY
jgi:sulfur transfer complex TusBCD TusB component (DsrH family)